MVGGGGLLPAAAAAAASAPAMTTRPKSGERRGGGGGGGGAAARLAASGRAQTTIAPAKQRDTACVGGAFPCSSSLGERTGGRAGERPQRDAIKPLRIVPQIRQQLGARAPAALTLAATALYVCCLLFLSLPLLLPASQLPLSLTLCRWPRWCRRQQLHPSQTASQPASPKASRPRMRLCGCGWLARDARFLPVGQPASQQGDSYATIGAQRDNSHSHSGAASGIFTRRAGLVYHRSQGRHTHTHTSLVWRLR